MTDPRFALALGISVLSGAVRGFSGFGSALVYVPLMSALYGPQVGAATLPADRFRHRHRVLDRRVAAGGVARGDPARRRGDRSRRNSAR